MKISYNWLKTLIDLENTPQETAELLTGCGLEVEGIEEISSVKGGLEGLVIGEVLTRAQHPNADRLSVTTVNIGQDLPLHIVCGAPNVAAGQKVVVAPVGTTVHPSSGEPFQINKAKIRGELSEGMICSEDEISLGNSHAGILVLPESAEVGTRASEYFKVEKDWQIEIGLTANRGDAASHLGVARDLAALVLKKVQLPDVTTFKEAANDNPITVSIEDSNACPRYSGVYIRNIKVADSPDWLKKRLNSIGIAPINNIVDCTNYVLHELGQPIHAFDAAQIKGNKIIVKRAEQGQTFITLDKKERKLDGSELMICNASEPMALAGIFGGLHSGISTNTKDIFIESATFNPTVIRKAAKKHELSTDASFRYERGTDADITVYAMQRVATLIQSVAGGEICGPVQDVYPKKIEKRRITFRYSYCNQLIGQAIDKGQIRNILESLQFGIISENEEQLEIEVPAFKNDIEQEADLVEEVLRIYGLNNIEIPSQIRSCISVSAKPDAFALRQKLSSYLCAQGFLELATNTLTNGAYYTEEQRQKGVRLANPLSSELEYMSMDPLFAFLEAVSYNMNRKAESMRFFEFGKTYGKGASAYFENNHLFLAVSGTVEGESWHGNSRKSDYYYLKTISNHLFQLCGLDPKHAKLLQIEAVSSDRLKQFGISQPVYTAKLNWDQLLKVLASQPSFHYRPVARFPEVRRDLSLVIEKSISAAQVEDIARSIAKPYLQRMNVFDVYEGDRLGQGKKAYALSFILQDENKTMTDKEIDSVMQKLIKKYEEQLGAVIRK